MSWKKIKDIKMKTPSGIVETFAVMYECSEYIFCECVKHPALKGFYTANYIKLNQVV